MDEDTIGAGLASGARRWTGIVELAVGIIGRGSGGGDEAGGAGVMLQADREGVATHWTGRNTSETLLRGVCE